MRSFKRQVAVDAADVFHNKFEFAETLAVIYNGVAKSFPVVIDGDKIKDRKKSSSDNADGIYSVDVVAYLEMAKMGVLPKKNKRIVIDGEDYNIISVENAMGVIVLELERLDER